VFGTYSEDGADLEAGDECDWVDLLVMKELRDELKIK
jgi:hypothetical protein